MSVVACFGATQQANAFGAEDPINGPYHHERLTRKACRIAGFTFNPTREPDDEKTWNKSLDQAAENVAWTADYIDSYLYNPKWWLEGGLDRYKVSLATYDELAKLHFDDLNSTPQINRAWARYLTGTYAGLVWARENNDVGAAQHLLGISLHAIQDFYAHSSWVDDANRRKANWFEFPKVTRDKLSLFSGAYEQDKNLGVKHHGKLTFECSIMNQPGAREILEAGCSGISPLGGSEFCEQVKACKEGVSQSGLKVAGVKIPNNLVYLAPAGIALDSTWQADIGIRERGVTGITGLALFDNAKALALSSSVTWLKILEGMMTKQGHAAFWKRVKTERPRPVFTKTARKTHPLYEFEDFTRLPYQFISSGPYPVKATSTGDEYYLRVRIKTSPDADAGTNADIVLNAHGASFPLDYLPKANPIIKYNDFEAGDDAVYTVGPFASLPSSIYLENRAPNTMGVLEGLKNSFVSAMDSIGSKVGSAFMSLVGGNAEIVGTSRKIWSTQELKALGTTPQPFTIRVNGGGEGVYDVYGTIRKVSDFKDPKTNLESGDYNVKLTKFKCIKESMVDGATNSDEPYVMALLVTMPGGVTPFSRSPISNDDVDEGEERDLNIDMGTVRLSKDYGMLSVPISIMESDLENAETRKKMLDKFAGVAQTETEDERKGFLTAISEAAASSWKVQSINVYAFSKGNSVFTGKVLDVTPNVWIDGGENKSWPLNAKAMKGHATFSALTEVPLEVNFGLNSANQTGNKPYNDKDIPR